MPSLSSVDYDSASSLASDRKQEDLSRFMHGTESFIYFDSAQR